MQARLAQWEPVQIVPHALQSVGTEMKRSVILDGEVVCLDSRGKSLFYDLLFRKGQPRFVAFDLLHCDGQDLTYSPLIERKQRLRAILPDVSRGDYTQMPGQFKASLPGVSRIAGLNRDV